MYEGTIATQVGHGAIVSPLDHSEFIVEGLSEIFECIFQDDGK